VLARHQEFAALQRIWGFRDARIKVGLSSRPVSVVNAWWREIAPDYGPSAEHVAKRGWFWAFLWREWRRGTAVALGHCDPIRTDSIGFTIIFLIVRGWPADKPSVSDAVCHQVIPVTDDRNQLWSTGLGNRQGNPTMAASD
jgi:hypothetical protein